tara:strand:- start:1343 stop:2200 length:858 start_codon:yes stop_codon:yes gene_type:complete
MVKSMTGYGYSSIDKKNYSIEIETRSLNSKFFDFNLKSNLEIGGIENEIRNFVKNKIIRGKVEISININNSDKSKILDKNKYDSFFKEIKNIIKDKSINDTNVHNSIFKNLSYIEKEKKNNISKSSIISVLKKSVINCVQFREEEGISIGEDIKKNINLLKKELLQIEKKDKTVKKSLSKKIKNKISSIKNVKFDKNRLEQEIFYYLEKLDINEEIVRLNKHIDLFIKTIDQKKPIGKKLNFICQEIGREINTVGSKSSEFKIQSSVINMKEYLEKIKEENFNIL